MHYTEANYNVRREIAQSGIAGAASATMAKFVVFQATRLKAVHALVTTAGTNTAAGFDVYVGTASVGAVVCGTDTAGTVEHSGTIDVDVPQNGVIELKGKGSSATLVVSVSIEHQVSPVSTFT